MPQEETRLAVAETRLNSHEHAIDHMQHTLEATINRLDTHIVDSSKRDEKIREELANVSVAIAENNVAVTALSGVVTEATVALKDVTKVAKENQVELVKWDTIAKTIAKIAGVAVIVVSGTWAVFTFVVDHIPKVTIQGK